MKRLLLAFVSTLAIAAVALAQQHPNQKKGFNANDVYQFNGLDTINAFNGNLTLSIPIGSSYSVGGGLSYALTLYSNANLWEGQEHCHPVTPNGPCMTVCPRFNHDCEQVNRVLPNFMYPHRRANAGLGWTLSLGRLYQADHPALLNRNVWTYESPDGADHVFEGSGSATYSQDGSYLRMTLVPDLTTSDPNDYRRTPDLSTPDPNDYLYWQQIEFPDGTTHIFQPPTAYNDYYALETIKNRHAGNFVNFTYGPVPDWSNGVRWTMTDSHGRTHYVDFQRFNFDGEQRLLVKRVLLSVWDPEGDKADFEFEYSQQTYGRGEFQNDNEHVEPGQGNYATVAVLDRVILPDATKFEFTYRNSGMLENNGVPESMSVPTGGMVSWEWADYVKPVASVQTGEEYYQYSLGVVKRHLKGKVPTGGGSRPVIGTWTYEPTPFSVTPPGWEWPDCYHLAINPSTDQYCHEYRTTITDPLGNKTINFFSVATNNMLSPWLESEYGLPFTKFTGDGTPSPNTRWLSTQVIGAGSTSPLRSTFVRYVHDFPAREESKRIRFDDDQGTYLDSDSSGWDSFGHYRTQVTSGTVPGTPTRTSYTNYATVTNANRDNPAFPWILGLYDYATVSENGKTLRTDFCFDANTGFLKQKRSRKDAASAGANDLVSVFLPDARGNVGTERSYGGDLLPTARVGGIRQAASVSTGDICSAVTGTLVYELVNTRVEPTASSDGTVVSKYTGVDVNVSDVTNDRRSGLVSKSRDTSGVETLFEYDWAGRSVWEKPTGRASTKYEFITPTSSEIKVSKFGAASSTVPLLQSRFRIDALGRVDRETTLVPGNTETEKNTIYNALGWPMSVSEPGQPTALTQFTYDPFGRVLSTTLPDGSIATTSYVGNREKTKTTKIRTSTSSTDVPVPVVEQYDGLGRLVSVTEKSGPTSAASPIGALVTTGYEYDLADRLTSVTMNRASTGAVQHRFFDYDGRGFLRWESQPESGLTSYLYDARGNLVTKRQVGDPKTDLDHYYDQAGRLTLIESPNPNYLEGDPDRPPFRPIKEFLYSPANTVSGTAFPTDFSKGKLWIATRYNYHDANGTYWRGYKVSDRYRYLDTAGRRLTRATTISTLYDEELKSIDVQMEYDELDLPKRVWYPMCIGCGYAPNVTRSSEVRTYDRGRLSSLTGFVSNITYWPNGLRNVMPHANGVADTQLIGTMARPSSIAFGKYDRCVKPKFTVQPIGTSVVHSGDPAVLTATATGTGTINYDWYGPNGLIDTTTSITVHPTATTEYVVVATNECGETYSNTVKVTVASCAAPEIRSLVPVVQPDRSWILTPEVVVRASATYQWKRLPSNTVIATTETLPVGPLTETTTFSLTVTDTCATPVTANVTIQVPLSMTTTAFTATANAARTQVTLTWPAVTGATSYGIDRRWGAQWQALTSVSSSTTSYVDTTVVAGRVYAYRVSASNSSVGSNTSNSDVASTATLSPVVAGQVSTAGGANSMLAAVNLVRETMGWPAVTWNTILSPSDPVVASGNAITARQLLACRTRMNEALLALGSKGVLFTDADAALSAVKAIHVNELQGALE